MGIATVIVEGFFWGLLWAGIPAGLLVYALLLIGRWIGGEAGMRIGTAIGVVITFAPFLWVLSFYARAIARGETLIPAYRDSLKGFALLGTSAAAVIAVAVMLLLVWEPQRSRARDRAVRG